MTECASRTNRLAIGTCLALTFIALAGAPALAADHVVVSEYFTRIGCGYCVFASQAMNMMMNTYPDTFIPVTVHRGDGYECTWGLTRWSWYSIGGTPTAWFEGVDEIVGAGDTQTAYTNYTNQYNYRLTKVPDVTVDVRVSRAGNQCHVTGEIGIEPGGEDKTLRIHTVQLLDYFPSSPSYSRNCLKQGVNYTDVAIAAGETQTVESDFTLDADSMARLENVKFVVFAQKTNATPMSRIYNAAQAVGPFNSLKGDLNCDGEIDFGDINPFILALTNPAGYAAAFPECDVMNADINEDGNVDFGDINPFVSLLTGP